jgi:phosphoadenosine phosphosulfate reductase
MREPHGDVQERLAASVRAALEAAVHAHGRVVYASSLGAESVVLTDIIFTQVPEIEIFSIDTGRLPQETHELMARIEQRYGRRLKLVHPRASDLASLTLAQGANGFVHSLEARLACCRARKIEPFRRAIAGFAAWVTAPALSSRARAPAPAGGGGSTQSRASVACKRCRCGTARARRWRRPPSR